ncbi:ABC1 kinase family protein [Anaerohalosphaeraceae bacterium U12dextr]
MLKLFSGIRRGIVRLQRYRHIMAVLMKYGFEELAGIVGRHLRVGLGSKVIPLPARKEIAQASLARRVRLAMEELGPTFIKLGQLLSTRPDLLPVEFIQELELLQDRVSPEKYSIIRVEVKKQLGNYPEEIFDRFDPEPIAAASIAQVHRARTKDGQEVVVKIRRPDIVKTIQAELEILKDLARLARGRFAAPETFDPQRMVREFAEAVSKEVDYANERRNQQRFIRNFANDPAIHVPRVLERYCSEGLLTMEYIEGVKPNQIDRLVSVGLDPKIIARRGADFVLQQVFEHGFFHTDPHPGNFLVMQGNVLAPLDFGQVGRLTNEDKLLLQYIVLAIVDGDVWRIVHGLERAEMLSDHSSQPELVRDIQDMINTYYGLPLKDIPFREVMVRGFEIIRKYQIGAPRDFTLMLKSLMTIESFARSLDEDFQIIECLKPYARKFALEQINPKNVFDQLKKAALGATELAGRLPEDAAAIIGKFRRGNFKIHIHHDHLEELEDTLDNSSNRISFAVIIAALLIGSSLLVPQDGTVLGLFSLQAFGIAGYLIAMIMGLWLAISIIRSKKY